MRQHNRFMNWIIGAMALSTPIAAVAEKTYEVEAIGSGQSAKEARDKALSSALKAIMDTHITEVNPGTEQQWARRLVLAYPEFIIQNNYRVMSRTDADQNVVSGLYSATVQVSLPAARLDESLRNAAESFKTLGQPTVLIIHQMDVFVDRRPTPGIRQQKTSDVAQGLSERLQAEGFRVIVLDQAELNKQNKVDMAELEGRDRRVILQLAARNNAHVYIKVSGRTAGPDPDPELIPGRRQWVWSADAKSEMYWTDDARLVGTDHANAKRADQDPDHGAVLSLQAVGASLAEKMSLRAFEEFAKQAFEGRPITITLLECTEDDADAVTDALEEMCGDKSILNNHYAHKTAEIRVMSKLRPDKLRRELKKHKFDGFSLTTGASESNTLEFTVKH